MSVHYFGVAAIRAEIERCMKLADHAEQLIRDAAELEVLSPAQFGIVCFRAHPAGVDDVAQLNALNERVNAAINATGKVLMSSTKLHGHVLTASVHSQLSHDGGRREHGSRHDTRLRTRNNLTTRASGPRSAVRGARRIPPHRAG